MEMTHVQRGFTRRHPKSAGFALLISVIFMSVMLSFGLTLGSLSYKQQVLASSAIESLYAFYAADTALECALYADQQLNTFAYTTTATVKSITCGGETVAAVQIPPTVSELVSTVRLPIDSNTRCADLTVYKYATPQPPDNVTTFIYSIGYDVPCSRVANPGNARFVSRGMSAYY